MNPLLDAALNYLRQGLSVIPIIPIDKRPLVPWEQFQKRRATEEEIRAWWAEHPGANIGILTGEVSRLVVVDIDSVEAKENLKDRLNRYDLNAVPRSRTGRGWQLFFKPPRLPIPNRTAILPNVDVRGEGGYIVAPPSLHRSGKTYKWEVPLDGEPPQMPLELFMLISLPARNERVREHGDLQRFDTAQALAGMPEGQRDENLFRLACKLRNADVPQDMAERLIQEAAQNCQPPFPEAIALEKVRRAYDQYQPAQKKTNETAPLNHHFTLIGAKDLLSIQEPETDWIWDGILPSGGLSLLVAKPKVGKTTLALNLAVAISKGEDFLGRKTQQAPVVYLALEEKRSEAQKKIKALGVTDEPLYFHFGSAPHEAIKEVSPLIKETRAGLLVIDVLQKFVRVKDLNDYAQVTRALEPLMATARLDNCHILLTHHAGKSDRQDGDDILGSTGLLGGVDTSVHIKKRDQRRTFFTIQRYGEDVPETVIKLLADGSLQAVGSRQEVEIEETLPLILEALDQPLTQDKILERVERKTKLVVDGLKELANQGRVNRTGSGKKGDAYVYEKIPFSFSQHTIGKAGNEFETTQKALPVKDEFVSRDSDQNTPKGETPGKALSTPKEGESGPQKGSWEPV